MLHGFCKVEMGSGEPRSKYSIGRVAAESRTAGWTESRIREELTNFLRGRREWPTYREFQRAGLKALRDQVTRRGGAKRWARRMGVRYVEHRPGYAPIWTDERIRRELADYLAGQDEWPSRLQFERDGRKLLRDAINRTGGPDHWAAQFDLQRSNRLSGIRRGWTPDMVEARLKQLIGDRTTWPARREFYASGLGGMLYSIYRHEGPEYWADRLGVVQRPGFAKPRRALWTTGRIREELERFCAGREVWPSEREFIDAGQRALYTAASRNGGIAYWAKLLQLPRGRRKQA
jgi:hypothetical protein